MCSFCRPVTEPEATYNLREGLDVSAFETVLKSGTCFTRTTVGNKELTYVLNVIQQPERFQACGSGSKSSADRRPIGPPPVVSLLVYERRDDRQVDITLSYEANFFLFATLEVDSSYRHSIISYLNSNHSVPILTGCLVSKGNFYLDSTAAIYFVFTDLYVRQNGDYRLCFNLYEMTSNPENRDGAAVEVEIGNQEQEHSGGAASPRDEFIWRTNINSAMFLVFYAVEPPVLAESTALSRVVAEQGVVRIWRPVRRVRQRYLHAKQERDFGISRFEPDLDETIFRESEFEENDCASLWNDSVYSPRKDSMSSMGETEIRKLAIEELSYNPIAEQFHGHNAKKPFITSAKAQIHETSLMPRDPKPQQHGEASRTAGLAPVGKTEDMRINPVISKEEIWLNFVKVLPPVLRPEAMDLEDSSLEPSIARADWEPLSHAVKRASHEWWLAHSSRPWEDILPQESRITSYRRLGNIIFLSWYKDFISGVHGPRYSNDSWLDFNSPFLDHKAEVKLVEQLVDDIYKRLDMCTINPVRQIPAETSSSIQKSASGSTNAPSASSQTARTMTKRRKRDVSELGDRSDDDEPYTEGKGKRKKSADQYSRYLICTEFAASQNPACPNCFFGAWPSVDRLKQDHLIKVHRFDSTMLKVDKGGTEPEKWWRLFDKLHPGFRETNPNTFIPGPLWEDRVAHNAYNKILSEAMREAERIRRRSTQALTSQIHDLLEEQLHTERQELRQMVSNLMSSSHRNTTAFKPLTPEPEVDRQSQSARNNTHNGERITPLLQRSDAALTNLPTPELFPSLSSFGTPSLLSSSNGPSLDSYLPALNHHSSFPYPTEDSFGTGTNRALISPVPAPFEPLEKQTNPPLTAMSTPAPSETIYANNHFARPNFSHSNNPVHQEPFGKLCRCRFHSLECTKSSTEHGNEWCVGCSGWFPWSVMAEPFFHH